MTDTLTITRPDDWHLHLRDGEAMKSVLPDTAKRFARAIVMPNLKPPITTVAAARAYRERILAVVDPSLQFTPLMTAYLTDDIAAEEIRQGHREGVFTACKLYPANATTNSAAGVTDIGRIRPVLEVMQDIGMPLLVHGELVGDDIDIFDREAAFLDEVLAPLTLDFPGLKIVVEHITTEDAVRFVEGAGPSVAATITAHHLVINRNHLLAGGIRPHLYCLPVAKRERHRQALRRAATSGSEKFFLGTDTAPHAISAKESACGCAGIFTAPCALQVYAQVFAEEGALEHLETFASLAGPRFYGLAANESRITLLRAPFEVPRTVRRGELEIAVFRGGETLAWSVQASSEGSAG